MIDDLEKHFQQLRDWLEMEAAAERERMAERRRNRNRADAESRGETLLDLVVTDHVPGLGGRFLLTFAKRNRQAELPWHRFKVGSPVLITADEERGSERGAERSAERGSQRGHDRAGEACYGVVSKRSQASLQVAVEDWPAGERFRIDLSADEVSRMRQAAALNQAAAARGRLGKLRDVLLETRPPAFERESQLELPDDLNPSQQAAIRFALAARDLAIIHGPPGTGKTTTVVELARQAVLRGEKVLACAPSNPAVDNLLERMADLGLRVVRIGHPARVHETLQAHTLDALVETDPAMELVQEMMREAEQLSRQAGRFTRGRPAPGAKQQLREDSRQLRSDARLLERQIVAGVLDKADIICATTTFDPEVLGDRHFDLAIIDEACQSTEPGTWPPVLRCDRLVLAGDHCQLPPTVLSTEAARQGFSISLMERLVRHYGEEVTRQLTVQYRMHSQIMDYSSQVFYGASLIAHPQVATHTLADLPGMAVEDFTSQPLMFIDTAGAGWEEELEPDGESRRNPQEGKLVLAMTRLLIESGLDARDIAVIAPYAAQVRWLRQHSTDRTLEIDTVDGFQGREKEAVVITLVRSNHRGEIGFLADTRRMNVALTRARRKLIVIGDSATLGGNDFYRELLEYFERHQAYHTVWELDGASEQF
jgi:ATP-dependent RNA/DNA helicase IGHMBP2